MGFKTGILPSSGWVGMFAAASGVLVDGVCAMSRAQSERVLSTLAHLRALLIVASAHSGEY
jgi:hypothetical protein